VEDEATKQKRETRQRIRELVREHLDPIVGAQIENAKGVSYMVLRHPDGTFARATDVKQIDAACAAGAQAFRIFTQQPNQQSASTLLAYAADKPVEPLEVSGPDGESISIDLLLANARKRLAGRSETR
jgi:hypothetical protein